MRSDAAGRTYPVPLKNGGSLPMEKEPPAGPAQQEQEDAAWTRSG
jgi:hypothetical protein